MLADVNKNSIFTESGLKVSFTPPAITNLRRVFSEVNQEVAFSDISDYIHHNFNHIKCNVIGEFEIVFDHDKRILIYGTKFDDGVVIQNFIKY